jgi:transposase-like protein
MMRVCPQCRAELPLSDFGARSNGKPQHWCRGCHRAYQRQYYAKHKQYYEKLQNDRVARNKRGIHAAKEVPCADCGRRYPHYVMDFDHRPGEKKRFNLANAAGSSRMSWEVIAAEIAKCDVVCANCHRERTYQRKHWHRRTRQEQAAVAQG